MTKQPSFEDRFKELQALVEQFERGEVPLAESLKLFKEGMTLVSSLEAELKATEQTLETIEKDFTKQGADIADTAVTSEEEPDEPIL